MISGAIRLVRSSKLTRIPLATNGLPLQRLLLMVTLWSPGRLKEAVEEEWGAEIKKKYLPKSLILLGVKLALSFKDLPSQDLLKQDLR